MLKISRMHVQELGNRLKVEQQRLTVSSKSTKAQINAQESRVQQLRALARLKCMGVLTNSRRSPRGYALAGDFPLFRRPATS